MATRTRDSDCYYRSPSLEGPITRMVHCRLTTPDQAPPSTDLKETESNAYRPFSFPHDELVGQPSGWTRCCASIIGRDRFTPFVRPLNNPNRTRFSRHLVFSERSCTSIQALMRSRGENLMSLVYSAGSHEGRYVAACSSSLQQRWIYKVKWTRCHGE